MLTVERLRSQGHFLFRWRGSLPFLLAPLLAANMAQAGADLQFALGRPMEEFVEGLSIALLFSGALVRILTVGFVTEGTSGRNIRAQRADVLNTTGLYSIVRNPLYVGNFLILLGLSVGSQVWWFALVAALLFALQYERIIATEETYLSEKFGSVYLEWAARTPAFVPNFRNWRAPSRPFSFRMVLRREYNTLLLLAAFIVILEIAHDLTTGDATLSSWPDDWAAYFGWLGFCLVVYGAIRYLKFHTNHLSIPDNI